MIPGSVESEKFDRFFVSCEQRGFDVPEQYRRGWRESIKGMPLVKLHLFRDERPIPVDVFVANTPSQRSAFERRVIVRFIQPDADLPVISAADVVLFKLLADRPKDRVDVHSILTVQGVSEGLYLRSWSRRLGVESKLENRSAQ